MPIPHDSGETTESVDITQAQFLDRMREFIAGLETGLISFEFLKTTRLNNGTWMMHIGYEQTGRVQ